MITVPFVHEVGPVIVFPLNSVVLESSRTGPVIVLPSIAPVWTFVNESPPVIVLPGHLAALNVGGSSGSPTNVPADVALLMLTPPLMSFPQTDGAANGLFPDTVIPPLTVAVQMS